MDDFTRIALSSNINSFIHTLKQKPITTEELITLEHMCKRAHADGAFPFVQDADMDDVFARVRGVVSAAQDCQVKKTIKTSACEKPEHALACVEAVVSSNIAALYARVSRPSL